MNKCSTEKLCKQCGKIIANRKADSKYCCDKCGSKHRNKYRIRKPLTEKQRELHRDKSRERQRRIRSTEEGRIKYNERIRSWKRNNKEKVIAQRRKYSPRKELGEKYSESLVEKNARDAFKWWMANKTDKEMMEWFMATGKPWLNPRLTASQQRSVRYHTDLEFNASEKARLYAKKMRRKHGIAITDDRTASATLLIDARSCLYCGAKFDDRCKPTIDHLIPLIRGGTHSAANLVVCCRSCNSRKGKRDFLEFVQTLSDPYRARSLRIWRKLRGAPVQQQALFG